MVLWSNQDRTRFFLILDDQLLPSGDFLLRTLTGREQCVDEAALAPYEVSEEQAKEWLKGEFGKMLDSARGAVNRFVEKLRAGPGKPDRIADLRELLDRIETILDLIVAEGGGRATPEDIDLLAERCDRTAARLRQIAERVRDAQAAAGGEAPFPF
jgi:hypothetical protein